MGPPTARAMGTLAVVAFAFAFAACGGSRHAVKIERFPAPLDPEIAGRAGVRAYFITDPEYGGKVYVVEATPPGPTAAPPLVLVHGLGTAGLRDFYPVLADLARSRRVVAFDLPGFAHSTQGNLKYTPRRYAAVLSRVIAAFSETPVDVLGHSMGGAISLLHAGTYPAQVRRLVLVDAAGILHREAWFGHHLRRVTDPAGLVAPGVIDEVTQIAATVLGVARFLDPAPEVILEAAWLRRRVLKGDPGRIAALSLILTDFGDAISNIVAPTLIVWGDKDMVAPLRTGQFLADRIADSSLMVLPGVGHNVMAEAPRALVVEVERHLTAPGLPRAIPPAPAPSQGDAVCRGQADFRLSGTYDDVVLEGCARVILDHVTARKLAMRDSSAQIMRSTITAGVVARSSQLLVTGGRIGGVVGLDLTDSDVDAAGVVIDVSDEPYRIAGKSKALFSVCTARTRAGVAGMHGQVSSEPRDAREIP